jgi:NADH-quinone oxidoreductase subunit G
MMTYQRLYEDRVDHGIVRNGSVASTSPADAFNSAALALGSVTGGKLAVVLSAIHSTEDNFAAVAFAKAVGTDKLYLAARGGWMGDDILRNPDNNPNRKGAERVAGKSLQDLSALCAAIDSGEVGAVLVLGGETKEIPEQLVALRKVPTVVLASHIGSLTEVASVVVPVSAHGEHEGSFVNAQGISQRFNAAVKPVPGVSHGWEAIVALAGALGKSISVSSFNDVRKAALAASGAEAGASA